MVSSLWLLIFILMVSCNRQVMRPASPDTVVLFPPPPATTRIQFLTQISSSDDLEGRRGGFHRYLFGEEQPVTIIKPYGITVKGTRIYISDTGLAGLVIFDLARGMMEYFIPDGKGLLQLPINCDVDEAGNLFIADANRKQIVVFDGEGNYLHAFGDKETFKPTDVEVFDGKIWVANVQGHAIHVYDAVTFELLERIPGLDPGEEGYIRQATNIAILNDLLYVSDFGDFNIKCYSPDGTYLQAFGGFGNGPGSFTRPKGIALDRDENLYVVDAAFENVQLFNKETQLLMHFGGAYGGPGAMYLPAAVEISQENLDYFRPYVGDSFELQYLVYVTNQYGPAKVNVYGFVKEKP
jgi:hypothetical protein